MRSVLRYLTLGLLAAAPLAHAAVLQDSYEARGWTYANALQVAVTGFDTTIKDEGSASLKLHLDASVGGAWGIVYTAPDFPNESPSGLATGMTIRVYLEPVGATSGTPVFKLAEQGSSEMGGPDTLLAANDWTTVTLPAANLSGDFWQTKFIIGSNGASGQFNIYVDNLRRDGTLIDGFNPGFASAVSLVNTEGAYKAGPADVRHLAAGGLAGGPFEGAMAYCAQWTGDTNNVLELQHDFSPALDASAYQSLRFDVYVPSGVTLPSIWAFFWDGSNGYGASAVPVTVHDGWQDLSLDISNIASSAPFNAANVTQVKLVMTGMDAAGTIYLDDLRFDTGTVPVELSSFAAE